MKKRLVGFTVILILILVISPLDTYCDKEPKVVMIVVDEFDFDLAQKLYENNNALLGIMSVKTDNYFRINSPESYYMTIKSGKRVTVSNGLFKDVRDLENGSLYVNGYKEISKELSKNYLDFSKQNLAFGEFFKANGINTAYIGNDVSSLIACDKNGIISYGEKELIYKEKWLQKKTKECFKNADILVISYKIKGNLNKENLLEEYINGLEDVDILVFPDSISGDLDMRFNNSLVPCVYISDDESRGILTSRTTRRNGLVTNLDVLPTVAKAFMLDTSLFVGNSIERVLNTNATYKIKENFLVYLNLNIIKYILHGVIIIVELYVIISWILRKKKDLKLFKDAMNTVIVAIFISFILGIIKLQESLFLYLIFSIAIPLLIVHYLNNRKVRISLMFTFLTNILILIGVFLNNEIIYNSFIGYNNIVAGGRFYGLNNEIMGVLLASSVISYLYLVRDIKNKGISIVILGIYMLIVTKALSEGYGSNFGGYITSIAIFIISLFMIVIERKIKLRDIFIMIFIGITILVLSTYINFTSLKDWYIAKLILRTNTLGVSELISMIMKKMKQFILMVIVPPWSIIFLSQLYFIIKTLKEDKAVTKTMKVNNIKCLTILFISSIIALLTNDTGVVSFVYMNTYLVAIFFESLYMEKESQLN